jgi:Na+-transporting NADH:ubiquinone oxidoreductase subunit NqrD
VQLQQIGLLESMKERDLVDLNHQKYVLWCLFMLGLNFEHSLIGAFSANSVTAANTAFTVSGVAVCHFSGFSSFELSFLRF